MSETEAPGLHRARLYDTDAVVLRRRDLGEADRILTVFTERYGKLRLVAKGVRRTKSRLAGHLEPLSRTSLLIARGRNLDIVTQASLVEPFKALRQSEPLIAYAGYLCDLLDAFTVEGQENRAVFELLIEALQQLNEECDPLVAVVAFELGLLDLLGFGPELRRCISCGAAVQPVVNGFSPEGGVLCPDCRPADPLAESISANALKFLRLIERGDLQTAFRLRLSPSLRTEIELALRAYTRHVLERDLGSLAVLRSLTH